MVRKTTKKNGGGMFELAMGWLRDRHRKSVFSIRRISHRSLQSARPPYYHSPYLLASTANHGGDRRNGFLASIEDSLSLLRICR